MKNIKKILALMLVLIIVLATFSVFAEEKAEEVSVNKVKVYEAKTVKIDKDLGNKEKWHLPEGKNVVFEDGKVINKQPEFIMYSYDEPCTNDLVQMDVSLNLLNDEGKGTWTGIAVRSNSKTARAWHEGGESYLFIIKYDRIELQKWHKYNQTIMAVVPNNEDLIKDDEYASISVGAVDTDEGVNLFMYVDDVCVVNVTDSDKENLITEGDNVTFYATEGTAISKYTGPAEIPAVPTMPIIAIDEENEFNLKATYSVVSFGKEPTDDEFHIGWYHSVTKEGDNVSEMLRSAINEFGVKYVGAPGEYNNLNIKGDEYEITPMLTGDYFVACVEDKDGNAIVGSLPLVVGKDKKIERRTVAMMDNAVVLEVGSSDAFVNGKLVLIDANDKSVKPKVVEGRTLVPVRFISESLGAEVDWNEETEEVTIELDGKKIVMTIGEKTYTVDGEKKELDVPATTISSRTMVPVRAISEAFGKNVFWDDYYELIFISDEDYGLDADEDVEIIYYMARRLGE